uniref:PRELI/MSF1 domain-containing protein n=1 Tax=Mycena chlorophos TaxID=658473 RepID=A0ABQ0KXJ4_MYCCL|nr:predicted protein [Mycena chlorophos]
MKFFATTYHYDDPWSIVTLAFFLRYPNPYASHVLSCDVVSRSVSTSGTLLTTRLILKRGAMPRWFPKGIVTRAESWVVEETEVDPIGRVVSCKTRNLDHVKIMQVEESVVFKSLPDGRTLQHTEARVRSAFGWGLTKRIEAHGLSKFKANMQRSREGVSLVLQLLRQSRLQPLGLGPESTLSLPAPPPSSPVGPSDSGTPTPDCRTQNTWSSRLKSWLRRT